MLTPHTFNADDETAAAPELTIGGAVYHGRVMSIAEWFGYKARFDAIEAMPKAADGTRTPESLDASAALAGDFLRAIFPPASGVDPIAELERRGFVAVTKAFSAFFAHHLYALGIARVPVDAPLPPSDPTTTTTAGTPLLASTTNAPSANDSGAPRS